MNRLVRYFTILNYGDLIPLIKYNYFLIVFTDLLIELQSLTHIEILFYQRFIKFKFEFFKTTLITVCNCVQLEKLINHQQEHSYNIIIIFHNLKPLLIYLVNNANPAGIYIKLNRYLKNNN